MNDAVVVATLFDSDSNQIYQTTLTASGSGGNYLGNIPASTTQTLVPGATYTMNVISTESGTQIDERNEQVQVTYRGLCNE